MRVKKFSAQPNAAAGVALKYSRSTKTSMGEDLTVVDPYERKTVVCRKSEVSGAGEGLYAVQGPITINPIWP